MPRRTRLLDGFISPATRDFFGRALARKDLSPFARVMEALHGYLYLRAPVFYIGVALGRHPASRRLLAPIYRLGRLLNLWNQDTGKSFADSYHGKVVPPGDMTRLIRVGREINLEVPEHTLPFSTAREIIVDNPEALAVLDCPCRASLPNPCLPLDVCLIVGKTFVDFVLQHHPDKSRRISVDEAVDIVEQSHKRGHVSHAFFKEAVLGRWYAVCNCCSCCCGAMQAQREGVPMLASSGFLAACDQESCVGCGLCAKKCPFKAIGMERGETGEQTEQDKRAAGEKAGRKKVPAFPRIDPISCMGCGICVLQCPTKALRLDRDFSRSNPLMEVLEGQSVTQPGQGIQL